MGDSDNSASAEARWRNYQHLIWTQQQIQLQIQQQQHHQQQQQPQQQQQQLQNPKMNGTDVTDNRHDGMNNNHGIPPPAPPMQEKSLEDKPKGEGMDPWDNFDAQAAFLGPTLWDKRLPYDGQEFKLEYVDLEEFLTENGIPVENHENQQFPKNGHAPPNNNGNNNGMQEQHNISECSPPASHAIGQYGPGPSRNQGHSNIPTPNLMRGSSSVNQSENSRSPSPCGSSISRSSDDSTSTTHTDSHPNGPDFDPRTRIFTEDELKPQPMIKKSKKQFVPDDAKDAKYWARRRKNNMAAKRSRDARRVKENQIAMRACFLEKENSILKQEIDRIQKENMMLKEQLNGCRPDH